MTFVRNLARRSQSELIYVAETNNHYAPCPPCLWCVFLHKKHMNQVKSHMVLISIKGLRVVLRRIGVIYIFLHSVPHTATFAQCSAYMSVRVHSVCFNVSWSAVCGAIVAAAICRGWAVSVLMQQPAPVVVVMLNSRQQHTALYNA